MISIKELQKIIPSDALALFQKTFSPSIFNKVISSIREERETTFRINTLKSDLSETSSLMRKYDFKMKQFDLIKNAFVFSGKINKAMKTELVLDGKIYFQSFSSMIPVLLLKPEADERILDIAASPGSKTTQIAAAINNCGEITAVEPDFIRMERLKYNAKILGASNIEFVSGYGESICKTKSGYFDKALADVPCSGEGRFSVKDKASYGTWRLNEVKRFSALQKKILKSAILSLKPGGTAVYSTCTLNVFENEEVINTMMEDNAFKIEILPVDKKFKELNESTAPILKYEDKVFNPKIINALRIIPSSRFEGFFICRIKRVE